MRAVAGVAATPMRCGTHFNAIPHFAAGDATIAVTVNGDHIFAGPTELCGNE